MKLVFIQPLGTNYLGEYIYEFLFTYKDEIEAGNDWAVAPASSGSVTPPPEQEICALGTLKSNAKFELAVQSDYHSFNDCVENIVAMAWQINHEEHEDRIVFHMEDSIENVKEKLYKQDLKLTIEKINTKEYEQED